MKFILGKKQNMMQCFQEDGTVIPATVISAGPLVVTQVKNPDVDGYTAVQVAYEDQNPKRATKAHLGHIKPFKGEGEETKNAFKHLREFRDIEEIQVGDEITVGVFSEGDTVTVSGISKSKGFQGVVKRHGFAGVGGQTHGQHNRLRAPGSIGAASWPSRVFKGMRMGGRMGGDTVTIYSLRVLKVIPESNLVLIKGSVPGAKGSYIIIER